MLYSDAAAIITKMKFNSWARAIAFLWLAQIAAHSAVYICVDAT